MKRTGVLILGMLLTSVLVAEEFTMDVSGIRTVEISGISGDVTIIGVSGNTLTISGDPGETLQVYGHGNEPPAVKTKGLKELTPSSEKNALGLMVKKDGNTLRINGDQSFAKGGEYTIKIPAKLDLKINGSPFQDGHMTIKGIIGELSVSTVMSDIKLQDIMGPLTLSVVSGEVEASFSKLSQKGPTTISVVNGKLDITIPASTPAELNLTTLMGRIFTDFDVKEEKDEDNEDKAAGLEMLGGSSVISGDINGGGVELTLSNVNGSIYIRKK